MSTPCLTDADCEAHAASRLDVLSAWAIRSELPRPGWAPDPLMVGIRSPDGLVVGLAPATLEFWVRFPNERNQGKQAHPVLKYRVPHGSQPFKALRQRYAGTRFQEQRQLHMPQKHKATALDSTLRVEMNNLEEQADNAKARELFWKPLSWLGAIRPTSANDAFDPALWETFVSTTLGLEVPTLAALPRLHNSPLAKCGCKKFCMDFHGDHTSTCTAHSGATKAHDWMVSVLGPLFRTAGHTVRTQHGVTASAGQRRGDVEIRNYLHSQAGSRSLIFDLSIAHDRFGSSSHVQQNGCLSHPQDLDAPLRIAAQRKIAAYQQQYADNQNISFLPAIVSTSTRMHGEFLRLLFLQAHRETEAHFTAAGMSSQRNQSDSFRFKRAAFYNGLKSKVGLAAAKAAALRVNLNVQGCGIVAPPMHAPSRTPLLLPLLLSHNLPTPRVH
jgi:hypothetical protein